MIIASGDHPHVPRSCHVSLPNVEEGNETGLEEEADQVA